MRACPNGLGVRGVGRGDVRVEYDASDGDAMTDGDVRAVERTFARLMCSVGAVWTAEGSRLRQLPHSDGTEEEEEEEEEGEEEAAAGDAAPLPPAHPPTVAKAWASAAKTASCASTAPSMKAPGWIMPDAEGGRPPRASRTWPSSAEEGRTSFSPEA